MNSNNSNVFGRKFGIEIECLGVSKEEACDAINGQGLSCVVETYNKETREYWKIITDRSVPEGFEVVSPVLSGEEGLEQVRKVSRVLMDIGAVVDHTCGFHVHVDANDLSGHSLKNIVKRYAQFERDIDQLVDCSRNNSSHCRSVVDLSRELESYENVVRAKYVVKLPSTRRYKVNIAAYLQHGTVEFRHHQGTVRHDKMIPWILFCVNFVENSLVVQKKSKVDKSGVNRKNSLVKKYLELAKVLNRYDSEVYTISISSLASQLEMEETSVPVYISNFKKLYGIEVNKVRGGGYYSPETRDMVRVVCEKHSLNYDEVFQPRVEESEHVSTTILQYPEEKGIFHGLHEEVKAYFFEKMAGNALYDRETELSSSDVAVTYDAPDTHDTSSEVVAAL